MELKVLYNSSINTCEFGMVLSIVLLIVVLMTLAVAHRFIQSNMLQTDEKQLSIHSPLYSA
jgi:hypothetical protein